MSRWLWFFTELSNRLWLRASVYGIGAVLTALASIYAKRYIPYDIPQKIGVDAVDGLLNILASSMLAVTIFSVSTMVSAYSAATNNVTPRATKLLIEDKVSQASLSTFIGSFIFSIVGIVALKTGIYGDTGRVLLFVVTVIIIVIIVVTLLRWIEYLSRLGRVGETIARVEDVATNSLTKRLENPYLGGEEWPENFSDQHGEKICLDNAKYVQHIDMGMLAEIAKDNDGKIFVMSMPGKFAHPGFPLAIAQGITNEEALKDIRKAFITGDERSFRQDPRFGLNVLSEIAIRALSPAINDPGTAIYCIHCGVRILLLWAGRKITGKQKEVQYKNVFVPAITINNLLDDFFSPIERDGANNFQVAVRLQKSFSALAQTDKDDLKQAVLHHSQLSLQRSLAALTLDEEKHQLKSLAAQIQNTIQLGTKLEQ